jgi:8-oxo-dGTP pyrophosphatase MutT (NUDIX family)
MIACRSIYGGVREVAPERIAFRPAAYAIIPHEGALALVTVRSTGRYGLPGGAVEPHERVAEALVREVREETGLAVEVVRMLHFKETFFYYDPDDAAFHALSFFFLCRPLTTDLVADELVDDGEAPEATCPRWVSAASLRPDDIQGFGEELFEILPLALAALPTPPPAGV